MAETTYNAGKGRLLAGAVTAGGTNLKAVLITGTKTGAADPDLSTLAAIDAVSGVGLHSERVSLTGVTVSVDTTNDRVNLDAANLAFASAAGVTALALVIYDASTDTSDATRVPLTYHDSGFGSGVPLDGGLTVTISDFLRAS